MDDSLDQRIADRASKQHGIFTFGQATEVGFTSRQREVRIRTGRWDLRHPGVYAMSGAPPSWRGDLLAACWAVPGRAMASHRSAAGLRDLPGGSNDLIEITCRRWRRAKVDGLVVHETKLFDPHDMQRVDGIPTASIEQTLLGLAAVVHSSVLEMAVDRALHRRLTTSARLQGFVQHKGKQGRDGVGVLRALLRDLDPRAGVPESAMETKLKQLLRRHGLPAPEFQYEIWHNGRFIARVDAAYPEHRIAIEYDSYEHHTGRRAIDRDSDRRAVLSRIHWETITFTASAIRQNGGEPLETLRRRLVFTTAQPPI